MGFRARRRTNLRAEIYLPDNKILYQRPLSANFAHRRGRRRDGAAVAAIAGTVVAGAGYFYWPQIWQACNRDEILRLD